MERKPIVIVVTGPSGAGKDTVIEEMSQLVSCERIVTHTDRAAREDESDGEDYHFVDTQTFLAMMENNEFVETKWFEREGASCWKGTSKAEFIKSRTAEFVIWRVEPTRGAAVSEIMFDQFHSEASEILRRTTVVYLGVVSYEQLARQQSQRDGHTDLKRIEKDIAEWEKLSLNFPNVVVNAPGAPELAAKEIIDIALNPKKRILAG